jgi:hypothetical protein
MLFWSTLFITVLLAVPAVLAATIDILLGPPVLLTTLYLFWWCILFRLGEFDEERHYLQT